MCTLALAFQTDRRWPLVVATNRDEHLGRPAQGWGLRSAPGGRHFAAPLDLRAGGTWIGLSAAGVFAGVTNYHAASGPDPSRRSRGELVGLALAPASAAEARRALEAVEAGRYNPFHLLVADRERAFLWRYDGERAGFDEIAPGLHVVTESSAQGLGPRGDVVRARWPVDLSVASLRALFSVHSEDELTGTCIHLDPVYGTRSSTILRLAHSTAAHSELYTADGPPCTTPFEDQSALLQGLARFAGELPKSP